jgi:integrase
VISRVPRIRLFRGEEELYLHMAPQPLKDVAMLMLDTGVRPGEASAIEWKHVRLEPASGSKFGHVHIPGGKSKNAKRNLSLTARVWAMLLERKKAGRSRVFAFPSDGGDAFLVSSLDHQHTEFRRVLGMSAEFVIHSLRHTMLTRLGESGAEAFTIMRIAGHSSVVVSQRYVHPSPESLENAFERLEKLNASKGQVNVGVPTDSPTAGKKRSLKKAAKVALVS